MSESPLRNKDEKDEKQEKEHEKDEKGRNDPLGTAAWGAIVIWAGLVLLADNMGLLAGLAGGGVVPGVFPFRVSTWGLIFLGAGVIVLLEVAVRVSVPAYRRPVIGSIILGFVFIGIGLGNLVSWGVIWAVVLIAIGIVVLLRGMGWRG